MRVLAAVAVGVVSLVVVVIGLVVGAIGVVLALYDADDLKQLAARTASQALGRELVLNGEADLDPGWVTRLSLHDIRLANTEWSDTPNMAQIDRLMVAVDVRELLSFDLVFPEIEIEGPNLLLEKNREGEPNWQFSGLAKESAEAAKPDEKTEIPVVRSLKLTDARLRYRDPTINRNAALDLTRLTVSEAESDRSVQVSGRGKFEGQPLSIEFKGGPWSQLRGGDEPYPMDLDATIADVRAKVSGHVADPAQLEGVDLKIDVRGDDMARLFPLTGIPLPPSPPYALAGDVTRKGSEWRVENAKGKLGDSDIAGTVAADTGGKKLLVKADLTSDRLVFDDLAPLIGARPGGQEGEAQKQAPAREDGRVLPDKEIDLSRLKAINADVAFNAKRIEAEMLPFDRLSTKMSLQDGTLRVHPAEVGIGEGVVRTFLSLYSSRSPAEVDIESHLSRIDLKRLLRGSPFAEESAGTLNGRAKISATGNSVADILATSTGDLFAVMSGGRISHLLVELAGLDIAETLGVAVSGDKPIPIRCAVANWRAEQGIFTAQSLVFDTTDTNIVGRGSINMREERIDLTFYPLPKDFSPLSMRTPLTVQGTFASPTAFTDPVAIGVEGTLKKVVNAILTPIVGLLPPVDASPGEDANCNELIARAKSGG